MNAIRLLVVALAALVGGAIGYQFGLTQGIASEGGSVVVHGGGFGFGWFFLLFLILLFAFAARPWWGHGPGGPGGRSGWRDRWHEGFEEWHRREHEAAAPKDAPPPNDRS